MSNDKATAGLVVLPNNCATHSTCARCDLPDRMAIPFDTFTSDGRWVCPRCAAHEWGEAAIEALHRIGVDVAAEAKNEVQPKGDARGWRLSASEDAFTAGEVPFTGGELVRVTIRCGMCPDLASVITNELLRRYRDDSPELWF